MSVRRVMGTETEYGISVPGQPGANAMVTSSQVVNAYQAATSARTRRARWDFEEENPLRDARGFHLTPFFVSRQVVCGAGRVGLGADGRNEGYQISQRADFFEVEVGLETTLKRPIINTRDEPHADPEKYRRLHVIIGDANMSEVSTYLKLGTTALVLAMIEERFLDGDLALETPVAELRAISHDPTCRHLVTLRDGRRMTAVQLQMEYLERARKYTEDKFGTDVDEMTADVLDRWESVLNRLAEDPMQASGELDWVAKLELLEGDRARA